MKIAVIGAGPGGYVCAIRAAQLGAEVHIIEKGNCGGTCLNVGCIPTKVLLHSADSLNIVKEGHGLLADNPRVDWAALQEHKQAIVSRLVNGVQGLLRANKVVFHRGEASFKDEKTVVVDGKETLSADAFVIATGSMAAKIPFPGHDLEGVIDSTQGLSLAEVPKSMVILGGGVIGCEFAYLFRSLGADITIIEMLPQILPPVDDQISALMRTELEALGIRILTGEKLSGVEKSGSGLIAKVESGEEIPCEKLLVSIGRAPNTKQLNLDAIGVKNERGAVLVDENFATSIPGIYAIGDSNAKQMLAHAAMAQGEFIAEKIMGNQALYNADCVPSCIFTRPQVAGVGLTEKAAKERGIDYKVGLFPLAANGKALIEGSERGLVKIITNEYEQIIGAHIIGSGAVEMIGEMSLAINMEVLVEDVVATIHAHPTISEAWAEAVLAVSDRAIHWPPGVPVR